jgi:hypothetical protein
MNLRWTIDEARGVLRFGHGPVPRTGNTYSVEVSGGRAGAEYVFSVVSDDAREILAQSTHGDGGTEIAFTSDTLRQAFRGRWHEQRTFHCVASDGRNVVAEGDLTVECIPVWTDAETGRVVSMRGPQGVGIEANEPVGFDGEGNALYQLVLTNGQRLSWTAPRGQIGESANGNYAYDPATGKYRRIVVYTNAIGEKLVDLDREELDQPPSGGRVVTVSDEQTITGAKTFTRKLEASGGVVGNLTGDVTGNLTGDVTGNLTGDVTGSVDATGENKTARVRTVLEDDEGTAAASTGFVQSVARGLVVCCRVSLETALPVSSLAAHTGKRFSFDLTPPDGYTPILVSASFGIKDESKLASIVCHSASLVPVCGVWRVGGAIVNVTATAVNSTLWPVVDVLLVKERAFKAVATGDVQSGGASLQGVQPPGTGPAVSNAGYAS